MNNEQRNHNNDRVVLLTGIGAQERSLRQLNIPYKVVNTCDCDSNAVLSYAAMRWDLKKEMKTFEFPSQSKMIEELQLKNLGYDFKNCKHTITKRTSINKLKQYYIADYLSRNLGDISKVDRLPYADVVTYSFCCQDLSCAGKGEGMKLKCDKCNTSWSIDFEHPENNNVCPNCGNIDIKSTRSGLLNQVQRLLTVSYNNKELPKYLLLENVKQLIGKKFKPQFDSWVKWLDSIGYNTYWKILNSKHYGTPQNRERVFAISIRKDIDTNGFAFPEPIPLTIRLKDILEHNVAKRYYLPDEVLSRIGDIYKQNKTDLHKPDLWDVQENLSCSDTVMQIGNVCPTKTRDNPNQGRVYDSCGVAPALTTMEGGNREPMIIEEEPFIVASRGRNTENPSDRTAEALTEQRLEPNFSGTTNCLTSVAKDNYVCEPQIAQCVGGIGEKKSNGGTQYYQQDRVYYGDIALAHPANIPGGSYKYVVEEPIIYTERVRENNTDNKTVSYHIRKLTEKECWRLMGFSDRDINSASKYVSSGQLYKQAGNSICTSVLIALFYSLFYHDSSNNYNNYLISFEDTSL